jgi:hypothetical protein
MSGLLFSLPTSLLQSLWPQETIWTGICVSKSLQKILGWWTNDNDRGVCVARELYIVVKGHRHKDFVLQLASSLSKLHWNIYIEFWGPVEGLGEFLVAHKKMSGSSWDRIVGLTLQKVYIWPEISCAQTATMLLAEGISGRSCLQEIQLPRCLDDSISVQIASLMFSAILSCRGLRVLDLDENGIDAEVSEATSSLCSGFCQILTR